MPVRLHSCTPTSLATWLDCPRRYRFTYVDRPRPQRGGAWAHNSLGASVHNALRDWWDLALAERTPVVADRLVGAKWISEGWRDRDQEQRWKATAIEWVRGYLAGLDPTDEPVGVERTVATRTETLALSGRIDRLDERDEGLVVVDYKTGRRELTPDDARSSMAMAVYAVAAGSTLRKPAARVELHHLPTGNIAAWDHTPESLARHMSRAAAIAEDVVAARAAAEAGGDLDEIYPTQVGPLCSWCDFRVSCPEGRGAGALKQPWAALGEEDMAL